MTWSKVLMTLLPVSLIPSYSSWVHISGHFKPLPIW